MKIYTVTQIDDPDFGCEGRMEGTIPMARVTVSDGKTETIVNQEDALLYKRKINEGSRVILDENNVIKKVVSVVAAIIEKDGKIFATQRGYGEFKDGWEFPGGKMEPGETGEQALVREIKEELDTQISVDSLFCTVNYDYPEFHLTMKCYMCHVISGKLTLLEHEDAKWLAANELGDVDWLPADVQIIEKLDEVLNQNNKRIQQVNFMNMAMICDGEGNVVALDKVNDTYTGTTFPGGHVEPGETFAHSMVREIYEETGLTVEQLQLKGIYHWYKEQIHNVGYLYKCMVKTGSSTELNPSEEGKVYWISEKEFLQKELAPGMDRVLQIMREEKYSECYIENGVEQMM